MAGETYRYNVVIDVGVSSTGARKGGSDVEASMTRMEQRAIAAVAKIQAALDSLGAGYGKVVGAIENATQAGERGSTRRRAAEDKAITQMIAQEEKANVSIIDNYIKRGMAHNKMIEQQLAGERRLAAEQEALRKRAEAEMNRQVSSLNRQIMSKDPFQKNTQIPLGQAGKDVSVFGKMEADMLSFNNRIKALDPFQTAKLTPANKVLGEIDANMKKTEASTYSFGQTFKGVFVGMVAGILFSTILGGFSSIINKVEELISTSVELAGKFQMTTNTVAVFSGSLSSAKNELAAVDKQALNTPGLRLETAEEGYKRLRALGFAGQTSLDIITGLAKQRLISGSTEQDVQRVIVNFTQLSASSQRVSQDIREIVHAMPSMRAALFDAFGTLDVKKLRGFIDADPEAFFKKLSKAMVETASPAGGFTNAMEKAEDAVINAERTFGRPMLEPLTEALMKFTEWVSSNGETWESWGVTAGDAVRGVSEEISNLLAAWNALPDALKGEITFKYKLIGGALANVATGGVTGALEVSANYGSVLRQQEQAKRDQYYQENQKQIESDLMKQLGYNPDTFIGPVSQDMLGEKKARDLAAERKRAQMEEAEQKNRIEITKNGITQRLAAIDNGLKVEEAMRSSHLRNSTQDEMNYERDITSMKVNAIRQQIDAQTKGFNSLLELNKGDKDETRKISEEAAKELGKLNSDLLVAQIEGQTKQNALLKQLRQEDLRDRQEYNRTIIDGVKGAVDRVSFVIEKQIRETGTGYNKLLDITDQSFQQIYALTKANYELQLQDEELTAQQRVNITAQMTNELLSLEGQHAKDIEAIEIRKREQFVKDLTFRRNKTSEMFTYLSSFAGEFGSLFNPQGFSQDKMNLFSNNVLRNPQRNEITTRRSGLIDRYIDSQQNLSDIVEKGKKMTPDQLTNPTITESYKQAYTDAEVASDKLYDSLVKVNDELVNLNNQVPKNYFEFEKLAKTISVDNVKAFDDLNASILKHQQTLDMADAQGAVDYYEALLEGEKDLDKIREYTFERDKARRNVERLGFQQAAATADQYAASLEGLNKELRELAAGDSKRMAGLEYQNQSDAINAQISGLKEINKLKFEIAHGPYLDAIEIERAKLQDIIELRNRERDAIITINRAQLEINDKLVYHKNQADAKVMDFLAQQKGITDIVSDTKIGLLTAAYAKLDTVAERLTKSFGAFKDVVKDLISSLLKLALNWVFQKLFMGSASASKSSSAGGMGGAIGGGPGNLLNILTGGFGGGIGPGGTAGFNPNAGFGIGGAGMLGMGGGVGLGGVYNPATGGISPGVSGNSSLHEVLHGTTGLVGSSIGGKLGLMKSIGSMLPGLGMGLGASLGRNSILGNIMGGVGGLGAGILGGIATGAMNAGTMFGGIFGAGGALSIGGLSAAMSATVVLAPIAGALLIGSFLIGRNKQRRQDETTRNQAMIDAFAAIDKLILDVKADRIDGGSAVSQAQQIREQYVQQMSQLKDKKTRQHALADVSRIDAKISILQAAADDQMKRQERMKLLVPTFADGGSLSSFSSSSYRNNPLGYVQGPGSNRSDSIFARLSNQEYVLDAETTKNIGVHQLDRIRQMKGRNLINPMKMISRMHSMALADGGLVSNSYTSNVGISMPGNSPSNTQAGVNISVENHIYENENGARVQTDVFMETAEGKKKLESMVEDIIYSGKRGGKIPRALDRVNRGL